MTKQDIIRKLTSRKLWVAFIGFITAIVLYVTGDAERAEKIGELILAGASVLGYVIGEGLADSNRGTVEVIETEQDTTEE